MSRYIDADKLICAIDGAESLDTERDYDEIAQFIEEAETADVVEVVRCENCKYAREVRNRNQKDCDYICCYFYDNLKKINIINYYRLMVRPDGYCYRGIEKDKEKQK